MSRTHLIVVALIALVAAPMTACKGGEAASNPPAAGAKAGPGAKKGPPGGSVATVETAPVDQGPFAVTGDYTGEFRSEGMASLSADTAGRIVSVEVHVGDEVTRGQVLAEIDAVPHQQRVRELQAAGQMAQASLEEARVQVANLRADLARKQPLLERKMVTAREIENLEAEILAAEQRVAVAQANIEQNRARLISAQDDLRNTKIRAPFDGRVAERYVDRGVYVSPNQPAFHIVDSGDVYLSVRIPERDSGRIRQDMPVRVRVAALGGQPLEGRIHRVAPALDPSTRTLRADITLDEDVDTIKPGMYARVQIELGRSDSALTIPNQALLKERDGTPYVWLVEGTGAERRAVVTGMAGRERTEITEGLTAGDRVVLRGHERLRPGLTIRDLAVPADPAPGGAAPAASRPQSADGSPESGRSTQ